MSESKRSFFSTIPGLVTGLAGLLTGIVGLVTVLIQLGVVGDDDSGETSTTTTTAAASATDGAPASGGAGSGGNAAPSFTVTPRTLDFKPTDPREKTVTVKNVSDAATLTVAQPEVTGEDADQFSVNADGCRGQLRANLSCTLEVTFAPSGSLRKYSATLQVTVPGARAQEVRLTGSSLLG